MTTYVFDSGPLIDLFRHYDRDLFPTLWERFDAMVVERRITSTREVFNELDGYGDELDEWCKRSRTVFPTPTATELEVVRRIFEVDHFQAMVRRQEQLQGRPVADPFVVARARCLSDGCVVTGEKESPNAAKIPNVCRHFDPPVDFTDLKGFMRREGWAF